MKNRKKSRNLKLKWREFYISKFYKVTNGQKRDYDGGYLFSIFEDLKYVMTNQELKKCVACAIKGNSKGAFDSLFEIDSKYELQHQSTILS
jgi:hypothetical protein